MTKSVFGLTSTLALTAALSQPALAQNTQSILKEIQSLKQDYESSISELENRLKEMEAKKQDSILEHGLLEFDETVGQKKTMHTDEPVYHSSESYEKTEAQKSASAKPESSMK